MIAPGALLLHAAVKEMVLSSKLNFLVICVPLGIAAQLAHWGSTAVFLLVSCSTRRAATAAAAVVADCGSLAY
jgi:hypothetical protein